MDSSLVTPLWIGIDPALASSSAEIKYTFRTLLRIAGFPYEFSWTGEGEPRRPIDIYYGLRAGDCPATITIRASGNNFAEAGKLEPRALWESEIVPCLLFNQEHPETCYLRRDGIHFANDIILTSYWLLTGAWETSFPRDRHDNFYVGNSFFISKGLIARPLVSIYGAFLRTFLQRFGKTPLSMPWSHTGTSAAFALTHDVDYPQIIRSIEVLRLLRERGLAGIEPIRDVLNGTSHFWKFNDWIEFAKTLKTRPTFYFMARQGSLLQYALGTPDGFYDVNAPAFKQLFRQLRRADCEIGLHASYHAHRSVEMLRAEKQILEEAAQTPIYGNRHHYWHLDPSAPYETLRKQEQAALTYDSSLEFEFYPGFRRGIAHPFHVFHEGEKRELGILELPPTWMDDHFDRRRQQNGILDCVGYARRLVQAAQKTGGIVIVDYHQRGMNHAFYPRYGRWLLDFMKENLDSTIGFYTPAELARQYMEYETSLAARSRDLTKDTQVSQMGAASAWNLSTVPA